MARLPPDHAPPPHGSVAGPQRGAELAVFRPPRGRERARPHQARASGHPSRSSRPAPGSWAWLYSAYIALVTLDARNALKVNVCVPSPFATSHRLKGTLLTAHCTLVCETALFDPQRTSVY